MIDEKTPLGESGELVTYNFDRIDSNKYNLLRKYFNILPAKYNPDDYASRWVIKGILPVGVVMLVGDSGSFKTNACIDIAFRIALGWKFLDIPIEPGQVVYFVGEGEEGFPARLEAWKRFYRLTEADMDWIKNRFLWTTLKKVSSLRFDEENPILREIRNLFLSMKEGNRPKLIVIDTRSIFGSGNEMDANDTGEFMRVLHEISAELGCCVLFIHHTSKKSKDGGGYEQTSRGSIVHEDNADTVIYSFRKKGISSAGYWIDKQRDGKDQWGWISSTATVSILDCDESVRSVAVSGSEICGDKGIVTTEKQCNAGNDTAPKERRHKQAVEFAKMLDGNIFDRDTLETYLSRLPEYAGKDLKRQSNPKANGCMLFQWLAYGFVTEKDDPDGPAYSFSQELWEESRQNIAEE